MLKCPQTKEEEARTGILTGHFNQVSSKGSFPVSWSNSTIVPIFQKRDKDSAGSYRGVSLLGIVGKCYKSNLNRLYVWLEDNMIAQAGF